MKENDKVAIHKSSTIAKMSLPCAMTPLQTIQLTLRPLITKDTEAIFRISGDKEIMHHWAAGPDHTIAEAQDYIITNQKHFNEHGFSDWAIELTKGRQFLGFCGLQYQHVSGKDRVGIGYALDKSFWNLGYGTEAALFVTDYAFSMLNLPEVIATVAHDNIASIKLLDKCGFAFDHRTIYDGVPRLVYRTTQSPLKR